MPSKIRDTSVSGYNIYLFDSAGASGTISFG